MTTNDDQPCLRIERRFDVPPETVFDTLTDPELMRIWWGDDAEFDIDLGVGGRWEITRREDGVSYLAKGNYLEIERPSRLQYTFGMPQFSPDFDTITIRIEADDGGSFVTFEHSGDGIAMELRDLPPGTRPLLKQAGNWGSTSWPRHGRNPPDQRLLIGREPLRTAASPGNSPLRSRDELDKVVPLSPSLRLRRSP